jgi:hypothetical protein
LIVKARAIAEATEHRPTQQQLRRQARL